MSSPSLFEQLGGEPRVRAIIQSFVGKLFDDAMIGFLFRGVSRQRLEDKEYEHAAAHLGGPVVYTGRPIAQAHARHGILGGHFMRRLRVLEQTLAEHHVPEAIVRHWLDETERLRPLVTRDAGSHCDSSLAALEPASPPAKRS